MKIIPLNFKTNGGSKNIRLRVPPKPPVPVIQMGYITEMQPQQQQQEKSKKEILIEGFAIPEIQMTKPEENELSQEEKQMLDIKYPLIPQNPAPGDNIYAFAHIYYDKELNEVVYKVMEPYIDERKAIILREIKEYIQEKVDIDFDQIRKYGAVDYLSGIFEKSLLYIRAPLSQNQKDIIKYYIFRDFVGMEKLEPLLNDKMIEDISCDGIGIPLYVYHRKSGLGSIRTNVVFNSKKELDSFVNKLAERTGKTISIAKPMLDGTMPNGSRVQATLGSDIARHGSNFTIRMFTDKPITPTDVLDYGSADLKMIAYMWYLIENGASLLLSGGTATGKTSMLNAISMFIKPQMKIVSIEDTAELKLPHAHWVPEVARSAISEEGQVDMFELLRESLRQRPDYIIVGEVRGKEAYVLFQQMATGHPGISTIHAETFPKLLDRLSTPPIDLPPSLIQNLDAIIFIKRMKKNNKYMRRVSNIVEIAGFDEETKNPIYVDVIKWDGKTDDFKIVHDSPYLKRLGNLLGFSESEVQEEIKKRAAVIKWMYDNKINDYKKIANVLNLFYTSPDFILEKIENGG